MSAEAWVPLPTHCSWEFPEDWDRVFSLIPTPLLNSLPCSVLPWVYPPSSTAYALRRCTELLVALPKIPSSQACSLIDLGYPGGEDSPPDMM